MINPLRIPRALLSRAQHPQGRKTIILASVVLLIVSILGYVALQKSITIAVDGKEIELKTFKGTIGQALTSAGITLRAEDMVTPAVGQKTHGGMTIKITRAVPVTVAADGKLLELYTSRPLVRDLLDQAGVTLGDKDRVEPSAESPIAAEMKVNVIRVREEILTFNHTVPYQILRRENDDMDEGTENVLQTGEEGLREEKVKVVYENGQEVNRVTVSDMMLKEKRDELVEFGTLGVLVASRGETVRYTRQLTMNATAYSAHYASTGKNPGDSGFGITATGMVAEYGVVAVDPSVIPLWTKVYVEGYGYAIAGDTGSDIRGNRIDLCFNTHDEAVRFGRRMVNVYVVKR
ncbi:MAG: ubiquitin-like domain-containing protein [Bacillota bacterium]